MEVTASVPGEKVEWRCVMGSADWLGTQLTFRLEAGDKDNTTLRFAHRGWKEASDYFAHCNCRWGFFLNSLKASVEADQGRPYPDDSIEGGEQTKRIVLDYWKAWQAKDWNAFRSALSDRVELTGFDGPDAFTEFCKNGTPWRDVTLLDSMFSPKKAVLVYEGFDTKTNTKMRVCEMIQVSRGKITKLTGVFSAT